METQCMVLDCSSSLTNGLASMWRDGLLCDMAIKAEDGQQILAHKVCLAAASGFFRAMFLGAGALMQRDSAGSQHAPGHGVQQVTLPEPTLEVIQEVVAALYDGSISIHPDNLESLLRLASYLDITSLLSACSQYMRTVLAPSNAVPLVILASRYSLPLKAELMSYICRNFSSLSLPLPALVDPLPQVNSRGSVAPIASASHPIDMPNRQQPNTTQHQLRSHLVGSWPHAEAATRDIRSSSANRQAALSGSASSSQLITSLGSAGNSTFQAPPTSAAARGQPPAPWTRDVQMTPRHSAGAPDQPCVSSSGAGSEAAHDAAPLCEVPKDLLLEVLSSDELTVDSEVEVLQLVVAWVAHEVDTRLPDLPDLLHAVRSEQISSDQLVDLGACGPAHARVAAAVMQLLGQGLPHAHLHPTTLQDDSFIDATAVVCTPTAPQLHSDFTTCHAPVSDTTQTGLPASLPGLQPGQQAGSGQCQRKLGMPFSRPRKAQPTGLVAAGGHDATWHSLKVVELYDPTSDAWSVGPTMTHSVSFASAALVGRELYMVGGTPLWSHVAKLVGRNHWQACPVPKQTRAHAGVVACASSLFVLGGRSQVQTTQQVLSSVEVYCPEHEQAGCSSWLPGPSMTTPRSALAAAACRGAVYAIGGQTAKMTLRSVERLDPGSERWYPLAAQLASERKYAAAAVLGGRVIVVGGLDEARTRLSLVEALDPREGKWQLLAPLSMPRSSAGVAALQVGSSGRLYAVGGSAPGDHVHDSMEMFVPEMGVWLQAASLGCGRSGLAVCAA